LANPEAELGTLVVLDYLLIGVFFALITLRDGRLELAIGAHAATNIFIALVASHPQSVLATPALLMADALDPVYSLISVIVMCIAFYGWFFWRAECRENRIL
jgi:nicotinamide riboside transporter PnuC